MATVTNVTFDGVCSQIYDIRRNSLSTVFRIRARLYKEALLGSFRKSNAMVSETTISDIVLHSKTCQHRSETRAANVW